MCKTHYLVIDFLYFPYISHLHLFQVFIPSVCLFWLFLSICLSLISLNSLYRAIVYVLKTDFLACIVLGLNMLFSVFVGSYYDSLPFNYLNLFLCEFISFMLLIYLFERQRKRKRSSVYCSTPRNVPSHLALV